MSPRFWRGLRRQSAVVGVIGVLVWLGWRLWPAAGESAANVADPRLSVAEWQALGTRVAVTIYRDEDQTPDEAGAVFEELRQYSLAYERRWAAQGPDTPEYELAAINRALAAGADTEIPAEMRPLFATAARYGSLSGGLFEVRNGRLLQLWGLAGLEPPSGRMPDPARLAEAVAGVQRPSVGGAQAPQLDFGSLVLGDAADQLLSRLQAAGFGQALVEVGKLSRAGGARGAAAWSLSLEFPEQGGQAIALGKLELADGEAAGTRSISDRYFEQGGRRYHDVIDPRSGVPAEGLTSATVVAANGALAAAASTALLVAGPTHWRDTAKSLGVDRALVIDAGGTVHATEPLSSHLRLAPGIRVLTEP